MVSTGWEAGRRSSPAARQGRASARGLEGRPAPQPYASDRNSQKLSRKPLCLLTPITVSTAIERSSHEVISLLPDGFGSLLRSWLRPHRGISQEKLPLYLGFFQSVHNTRRRGKALLGALIAALVACSSAITQNPT